MKKTAIRFIKSNLVRIPKIIMDPYLSFEPKTGQIHQLHLNKLHPAFVNVQTICDNSREANPTDIPHGNPWEQFCSNIPPQKKLKGKKGQNSNRRSARK